jgi:hypothetical protein
MRLNHTFQILVFEIEKTPDAELQTKMKDVITQFPVLSLIEEVEWLANEYIL